MNRFKKELRRKGIKLECDYPWLPYNVYGNIVIEDVLVNSEKATFTEVYNVIAECNRVNRDGSITNVWTD